MITIKHDFSSPIIRGRRVHIDYEQGVKVEGEGRSVGTFHCRVVGGPARVVSMMLTDRSEAPTESREGFAWAAHRALDYARAMEAPIRRLTCCVCGSDAGRWHQHWNRDTGYGVCRKCVAWVRGRGEEPEEIEDLYGIEGVNYALPSPARDSLS